MPDNYFLTIISTGSGPPGHLSATATTTTTTAEGRAIHLETLLPDRADLPGLEFVVQRLALLDFNIGLLPLARLVDLLLGAYVHISRHGRHVATTARTRNLLP